MIGIIGAMDAEVAALYDMMEDREITEAYGYKFAKGKLQNRDVVLARCGIGKVNAAIGATDMINAFAPDMVISTGVAGGADTSLEVQEVVASTQTCYHDAYCGSEVAYGQIIGSPARFDSDATLIEKAMSVDCGTKINKGLIVTGDWFVDSREKMSSIIANFPDAMAVDMESTAIAHVCHQYNVPFISFRIISDIPLKDNKAQQYFDFWEKISDNSFNVTKSFLEKLTS